MKYDLHCHSVFSDGTWTPEDIINYAKENSLVPALTDHNTTAGLTRFMNAARERGVEAVPGVEFSSSYKDCEFHILALFIDSEYYPLVEDISLDYKKRKEISNIELIAKLNDAGYDISFEELKKNAVTASFNRAVIASEMKKKGYVETIDEAFKGVLNKKTGFYVPPERKSVFEIIDFIKSINAVSVLAHPLISADEETLEGFLPEAKKRGLAGIETRYSLYSDEMSEKASRMAEKYGLLESGGSDFHGANKPDIELITGKGNLFVPEEFYLKLKNYKL